jgi:hypothetical protein
MPKAINIRRYLHAFHPSVTFTEFTLGDDMPARKPTEPDKVYRKKQRKPVSYSTGKLEGKPDKQQSRRKPVRHAISAQHTMRSKSRGNAGFNRGMQSAIATLDNGDQIVLMVPARNRRGSKYSGGLS